MKKKILMVGLIFVLCLLVATVSAAPKTDQPNYDMDRTVSAATTTHTGWWNIGGAAATIDGSYPSQLESIHGWSKFYLNSGEIAHVYMLIPTPYPGNITKGYVILHLGPNVKLNKIDIVDGVSGTGFDAEPIVISTYYPNIIGASPGGSTYAVTFNVNKAVKYAPEMRLTFNNQDPTSSVPSQIYSASFQMTYKA